MDNEFWQINLKDTEWPDLGTDHDRSIVRAIVIDDEGFFYFVHAERDDEFGVSTLIETSGGGVEPGENLDEAIHRELKEELGVEVEILDKIGIVSDYYNLIHRHNINNYYLCKIRSFGDKNLTQQEIEDYHLTTLKLSYNEALSEYEKCSDSPLGRLIAQRELPVLRRAKELLDSDCKLQIMNRYFRVRSGALLKHNDEMLFVKCGFSDYYYVMGGAIHICETSKECIEREIFEETGIKAQADRLVLITENFFSGAGGVIDKCDCHTIEFYYLVNLTDEQVSSCKAKTDDGEELIWLPIKDLENYNIKPTFVKERINELLSTEHVLHILEDRDKRKE